MAENREIRTMGDYAFQTIGGYYTGIRPPVVPVNNFEIKPSIFQMIQTSLQKTKAGYFIIAHKIKVRFGNSYECITQQSIRKPTAESVCLAPTPSVDQLYIQGNSHGASSVTLYTSKITAPN